MTHLGSRSTILAGIALSALSLCVLSPAPAAAQTVSPPYALSVFAKSVAGPNGYTQPDSIALWGEHVFVGFQNGVAKDGTDGKSSTIVQYSQTGEVERMFSVKGHNDGLRVIGDDKLWAIQNEDANPNIVIIDLKSGFQSVFFPPAPHGGGYDDLRVFDGNIYISASNPNLDAAGNNVFPALVRVTISGSVVHLDTVLMGNATATDIPTGNTVTLNLTDPDSLSIDQRGNIVLDSQQDAELVFIRDPLTDDQTAGRLSITTALSGATTLDDTVFAPKGRSFLLASDVAGNTVYRIDAPQFGFEPGTAYSASDTLGIVGTLNLDNGVLTPIATGFGSMRGMAFVKPDSDDEDRFAGDNR